MRVSPFNPLCSVGCMCVCVCVFRLLRNIAFNAINGEECDAGSSLCDGGEQSRIRVLVSQRKNSITIIFCVVTFQNIYQQQVTKIYLKWNMNVNVKVSRENDFIYKW